jgi:hypothetical protein
VAAARLAVDGLRLLGGRPQAGELGLGLVGFCEDDVQELAQLGGTGALHRVGVCRLARRQEASQEVLHEPDRGRA